MHSVAWTHSSPQGVNISRFLCLDPLEECEMIIIAYMTFYWSITTMVNTMWIFPTPRIQQGTHCFCEVFKTSLYCCSIRSSLYYIKMPLLRITTNYVPSIALNCENIANALLFRQYLPQVSVLSSCLFPNATVLCIFDVISSFN